MEVSPLSAKYDQQDLLTLADQMANDILSHPFPPEGEDKPILVTLGIQNRTQTHLDMKALADTIETRLLNTGKIRLVNASRRDDLLKEQGYQLANVTPETRVQIGKQLGARYMMTGSLVEIEKESGREVRVGFAGFNAGHAPACACWFSRWALDYFARSIVPEPALYSVAVLDSAGNLILRMGHCGNVDDGLPLVKEGGPSNPRSLCGDEVALFYACYTGTHTDRRIFISDVGNGRILRVKLGYHAEERIALKNVARREEQ